VKIGLRVEEPSWIEVDRGDDFHGADRQLKALVEAKKRPTIVLVMLGNERHYKSYKSMCYQSNIIS
jgi:aubergine-like protein